VGLPSDLRNQGISTTKDGLDGWPTQFSSAA